MSVNTNSPDCFGVVRSDKPTLERCVFIEFLPNSGVNWDEMRDKFGLNDKDSNYEEKFKAFCAAFYQYLRYDYVNPYCPNMMNWNPQRDRSEGKWNIVAEMRKKSERLPMRFIKTLCTVDEYNAHTDDTQTPIVELKTGKKVGRFAFILLAKLTEKWNNYVEALPSSNREKRMYTIGSVREELENGLGWQCKKLNMGSGYMLSEEKYKQWRQTIDCKEDDDDFIELEEDVVPEI